jgi:hypothetical protein
MVRTLGLSDSAETARSPSLIPSMTALEPKQSLDDVVGTPPPPPPPLGGGVATWHSICRTVSARLAVWSAGGRVPAPRPPEQAVSAAATATASHP